MSDVQFDEGSFRDPRMQSGSSKQSKMVMWLLKTGIVKDEKTANYVLIGISICAFSLTLYVIFF